jgi:hypothetical protein
VRVTVDERTHDPHASELLGAQVELEIGRNRAELA